MPAHPNLLFLLMITLVLAATVGCGTEVEAGGAASYPGEAGHAFDHERIYGAPGDTGIPTGAVLMVELVEALDPDRTLPGDRVELRLMEAVPGVGVDGLPAGALLEARAGTGPRDLRMVEIRLAGRRHAVRGQVESIVPPSANGVRVPPRVLPSVLPKGTGLAILLTAPIQLP